MSYAQYCWFAVCLAFPKAWAIFETITGIISLIGGIIVWKYPTKESTMKNLIWMIPLFIMVIAFVGRLLYAPYAIYKNQETKINELSISLETAKKQAFAPPDALIPQTLSN